MTHLNKESYLYDPVATYIRRKGFRWQGPEIQFYEYRIDLYAYSRSRQLTIAVELKLYNWQRAINQAIIYQLCADLVYIAVPKTTAERIDKSILDQYGIGLITIDNRNHVRQLIAAEMSYVLKPHYRDSYIQQLLKDHKCKN